MSAKSSVPEPNEEHEESGEVLSALVGKAVRVDPVESIFALLRVSGTSAPKWDPLEESEQLFSELNWALVRTGEQRGVAAARRVALIMYCHAIEMTAPQELLANLLRVANGQRYRIRPFERLPKKGKNRGRTTPTLSAKYAEIRRLAAAADQDPLLAILDRAVDRRLRNAVAHADYVLTDSRFRWFDGRVGHELSLDKLDATIRWGFAFFSSIVQIQRASLIHLADLPRFHPQGEGATLEILVDGCGDIAAREYAPRRRVIGFELHTARGTCSRFSRTAGGVESVNIGVAEDGGIESLAGTRLIMQMLEPRR